MMRFPRSDTSASLNLDLQGLTSKIVFTVQIIPLPHNLVLPML